jgi:hypothetical protein
MTVVGGTHLVRLLVRGFEQISGPGLRDYIQEVENVVYRGDEGEKLEWQRLVRYDKGYMVILLGRAPVGQRNGRGNEKTVLTRIGSASSNTFRTAVSSSNNFVLMRYSLRAIEAGWFQGAQTR